ncbi:MAG TPA: hypothetical protein DEQ40_02625 [Oxalobacteraceae bacterium]|jgi:hypothetical protein|nr:hypothetical protein [Oxalobacteraceae bacterium]
MGVQDLERIESKIDRTVAGAVIVSDNIGGIMFKDMAEVMEFSKLLAVAGAAVPKHLRGNVGACLAVTIQALEWRMSPIAVANKSYEVNDRIAYESQLIHAVVEARAPLKQRLRKKYSGEGPTLQCFVTGHFKGEVDPIEYESPKFSEIKTKNSPLWTSDPRQQLWYYSVRAWARANCPDVLLGIYAEDELEGRSGADHARDVTPKPDVAKRLTGSKGRGFSEAHVDANTQPQGEAPKPEPEIIPPGATQQLDLAADVENEIANKKRAVENAETLDDVTALVSATTDYLKQAKRTDLLADFLSVAKAREKKLTTKGAAA